MASPTTRTLSDFINETYDIDLCIDATFEYSWKLLEAMYTCAAAIIPLVVAIKSGKDIDLRAPSLFAASESFWKNAEQCFQFFKVERRLRVDGEKRCTLYSSHKAHSCFTIASSFSLATSNLQNITKLTTHLYVQYVEVKGLSRDPIESALAAAIQPTKNLYCLRKQIITKAKPDLQACILVKMDIKFFLFQKAFRASICTAIVRHIVNNSTNDFEICRLPTFGSEQISTRIYSTELALYFLEGAKTTKVQVEQQREIILLDLKGAIECYNRKEATEVEKVKNVAKQVPWKPYVIQPAGPSPAVPSSSPVVLSSSPVVPSSSPAVPSSSPAVPSSSPVVSSSALTCNQASQTYCHTACDVGTQTEEGLNNFPVVPPPHPPASRQSSPFPTPSVPSSSTVHSPTSPHGAAQPPYTLHPLLISATFAIGAAVAWAVFNLRNVRR